MARVEKYQETPPDDGVIVHQSVPPIPLMMGFPHLSKGLDGFLIGDLDRTAREVAESMAAPVEIDLAMPVDLGLGNAAAATKAGGRVERPHPPLSVRRAAVVRHHGVGISAVIFKTVAAAARCFRSGAGGP